VTWQSVLPDGPCYSFDATVVEDGAAFIVLAQRPGDVTRRRTGERGGPRGRSMLPGGWDGGRAERPWRVQVMVHAHQWSRPYFATRRWNTDLRAPQGWYVNLAGPWRRSGLGVDTRDLVLDIVCRDDLSSWEWKDEDELEWSAEVGKLSHEDVLGIRQAGSTAVADLEAGRGVFDAGRWDRWAAEADAVLDRAG
jgi:hypothetical protein